MSRARQRTGQGGRERGLREVVYALLQLIPPGRVTTYGSIARVLGTSPRAVGRILASNDRAPAVPCHRVVMSGGSLGGYSFGGARVKRGLLELEGVRFVGDSVDPSCIVDVEDLIYRGTKGPRARRARGAASAASRRARGQGRP